MSSIERTGLVLRILFTHKVIQPRRETSPMKIHIKTYGILRDQLGKVHTVDLPEGSRLMDLIAHFELAVSVPWLTRVNGENVSSNTVLCDGDQVQLIPPTSGG